MPSRRLLDRRAPDGRLFVLGGGIPVVSGNSGHPSCPPMLESGLAANKARHSRSS